MPRFSAALRSSVAPVRRSRGLTQEQLARQAGVSRQTIAEIEGGDYNPSTVLALRLAALLEVPVEELFQLPEAEHAGLVALREAAGGGVA
jgi:putative transcriptional regulator